MNRYLIDTNVISEPMSKRPDPRVMGWLGLVDFQQQYLSVITLAELQKGIVQAKDGQKRRQLQQWYAEIPTLFAGRILPIDIPVAKCLGEILGTTRRTLPPYDLLIAATAITHNLTLVTRNAKDFDIDGLELLNPWNIH